MDTDDLEPPKKSPVALAAQDLSMMSIEDLEERIEELTTEIERCRKMIASKKDSRASADSIFKS